MPKFRIRKIFGKSEALTLHGVSEIKLIHNCNNRASNMNGNERISKGVMCQEAQSCSFVPACLAMIHPFSRGQSAHLIASVSLDVDPCCNSGKRESRARSIPVLKFEAILIILAPGFSSPVHGLQGCRRERMVGVRAR